MLEHAAGHDPRQAVLDRGDASGAVDDHIPLRAVRVIGARVPVLDADLGRGDQAVRVDVDDRDRGRPGPGRQLGHQQAHRP